MQNQPELPRPSASRANCVASDEELVVRYRDDGDLQAFETLVRRYEGPIYRYLVRFLRSMPLAEDVFQATFLRLHQKCNAYQANRQVRPWLYSIATHLAVDALRSEGRHQAFRLEEGRLDESDVVNLLQLLPSEGPSPGEQAEQHERAEWTREAVDQLPEHERIAVLLIFFQGLKYREAAEILRIPEGTVKSRIHKAIVTLQKAWRRNHVPTGR